MPDAIKPPKITEEALGTIVDDEIRQSIAYMGGTLSEMRRKAMYYYLGEAQGDLAAPAIHGRSSVVSTDVSDTIEWTLPALMEIFTAGDDVVEFVATCEHNEDAADQMTDVANYVFYQQNPGWAILESWIRDALLLKNGILKVYWDDHKDETREEYEGQTTVQLVQLLNDPEVEPIEHRQYPDEGALAAATQQYELAMLQYQQAQQQMAAAQPPQPAPQAPPQGMPPGQAPQPPQQPQMPPPPQPPDPALLPQLHDVTLKRTRDNSQIRIVNVPPEEFIISRRGNTIPDTPFCGHHLPRTVSELRAQGYENVDDISSDGNGELNEERIERDAYDDDMAGAGIGNEISGDPSQRVVWITESYLQVDYDNDGIAEGRKVVRGGGVTLENVEFDEPPFVSITPIRRPHRFFGRSLADLSMPTQRIKTSIWRGLLDNMYLQINGRTFAVDNQVNIDDLLNPRPGGVVRVKQAGAVGPLQQGMSDSAGAYQMLEYADTAKQESTGVMKLTQGSDADLLNKTATGNKNMTDRSEQRIKLIARGMAETGIKDLFRMIQKLLSKHQKKAMTIKLRDKWVDVDPRAWKNRYDMTVNVGLGTGDKTQVVQKHMTIGTMQAQGLQIGIATPENIYNNAVKATKALGEKNADAYWTDPSKVPPKPPAPNPEMIKVQGQQQLDQAKLQGQQQLQTAKQQGDMQQQQAELQQKSQSEALDRQHQAQLAAVERQYQAQTDQNQAALTAHLEALKSHNQMAIEQMRMDNNAQMQILIQHLKGVAAVEVAEVGAGATLSAAQISAANQQAPQPGEGA